MRCEEMETASKAKAMGASSWASGTVEQVFSWRPTPAWKYFDPVFMVRRLWAHRELAFQLTRREVRARYRGSYLGLFWSLLTPLMTLTIYTFVFGVIFKARWGQSPSGGIFDFALTLFSGLIIFTFFTEIVNQAPTLFLRNPNYAKKVVFPLEILPVSMLGASLVAAAMSFLVLALGLVVFSRLPGWRIILLPLPLVPLCGLCLGLGWFLATLGVFVRDISNGIEVATRLLMFATPIFYPISLVPDALKIVLLINPLTWIIENVRRVFLWNQMPNWGQLGLLTGVALVVMLAGYASFRKGRRALTDVI